MTLSPVGVVLPRIRARLTFTLSLSKAKLDDIEILEPALPVQAVP
jgi:hypothetical protein